MRFKVDIHFNPAELRVNRVIRFFVLADLFLWGGWGFISPIFALFAVGKVAGATVLTVGIASALYWVTKSLLQLPMAIFLDRRDGDHLDLHVLIVGIMLAGFDAMAFPLISSVWSLYALTALQGAAFALYTPSWSAVFSRHLDKNHYAFDWSLDSTTVGISSGVAALVGGIVARLFGFDAVFILTGAFSFASAFLLLAVPNLVLPKATVTIPPILPEHAPSTGAVKQ